MAIADRFPGGRPLRRRRQMGLALANRRLRGTTALHASTDHRCHDRTAIAGRFPGGRPLRRRRQMVLAGEPAAARDRSPPVGGRKVGRHRGRPSL
jgi:hypothetical protein